MNPLRPAITLLLSVSLSIGLLSTGGHSQQPAQKPGAQPGTKQQAPKVPAASKEKKAAEPADKEGATAEPAPKGENKSNLAELQQRGLDLAQQVGEAAYELDDRRNSAIIQAVAADLIWPYRNEPARELFRKAFETAVTHYQKTRDDNRRQISKNSWTSRQDVRVEVLKLINKRDPKMGDEYTEKFIESKKRDEEERATR